MEMRNYEVYVSILNYTNANKLEFNLTIQSFSCFSLRKKGNKKILQMDILRGCTRAIHILNHARVTMSCRSSSWTVVVPS